MYPSIEHAADLTMGEAILALPHKRRVVLIDDDECFRTLFRIVCEARGVQVATFASLAEMPSFAALREYDVVVLDYYLESFKGSEIAEYVDVFFAHLPVVVISGADISEREQQGWPICVRRFVKKAAGPRAILDEVLDVAIQRSPAPKAATLN